MGDLLLILVFSIVIWIFGLWISKHFYKENGFLHFMLCAVFSLLTITVLADLFPQAYQLLVYPNRFIMIPLMFGGMLLGGLVIYLIDRFIPFGSDDLSVSNESKQQLLNVGMITSLAYAFYSITSGIVLIYLLIKKLSSFFPAQKYTLSIFYANKNSNIFSPRKPHHGPEGPHPATAGQKARRRAA